MAQSPIQDQILDQAKQKGYVCNIGSYCSPPMKTPTVPGSNGGIYHRTTTTITDNKATTDVYIFRQGTLLGVPTGQGEWVKAGTTTDGGRTYTFNDTKDSNGNPIIGTGVRQSLSNNGDMNKNVRAQVTKTLKNQNLQQTANTPNLTDQQIQETQAVATSQTGTEGGAETQTGIDNYNQTLTTINQQIIGEGNNRQSYGHHTYPFDRQDGQDYIKFTMYKFQPKSIDVKNIFSGNAFGVGNKKGTVLGTVTLPIQPQISDSNRVVWGENNLDAIQSMAGAAAMGTIANGTEAIQTAASGVSSLIERDKGSMTAGLTALFASRAIGANSDFFTRATGAILNPNLELLFQGPALRSFSFNFTMSARDPNEAQEIKKIIRFFKQGMSVKRAKTNLFLLAPNVFDISYVHNGNDPHPWINMIKTCALQDCSVNYTPDGNYATYEDGAMTKYDMTLTFGEIDPIYDDDYEKIPGGNNDTHIGY